MIQVQAPFPLFFDKTGNPIDNGSVYIGEAGSNPQTNPIQVSWDVAGLIAAAQPLKISGGMVVRYSTPSRTFIDADDYSMAVYDKNGVLMWSTLSAKDPAAITNTAVNSAITAAAEAEAAQTASEAAQAAAEAAVADFETRLDSLEEDVTDNAALSLANSNAAKIQSTGAVVTLSGSAVDFTSIPAGVKRVEITFDNISRTTGGGIGCVVGTPSGFATTGYSGACTRINGSTVSSIQTTEGLTIFHADASESSTGKVTFTNLHGNLWVGTLQASGRNFAGTLLGCVSITLPSSLTSIRIFPFTSGTFDSGVAAINWELGHTIEETEA